MWEVYVLPERKWACRGYSKEGTKNTNRILVYPGELWKEGETIQINDHDYETVLPDGLLWGVTHELYDRFRREIKNAKN